LTPVVRVHHRVFLRIHGQECSAVIWKIGEMIKAWSVAPIHDPVAIYHHRYFSTPLVAD